MASVKPRAAQQTLPKVRPAVGKTTASPPGGGPAAPPARAPGPSQTPAAYVGATGAAPQLSGVTTAAGTPQTVAVRERPIEKAKAEYDDVIVGTGAGGAPLAARLAEQGYKVLMLEGGKDRPAKESQVPLLHGAASENEDLLVDGQGYFVEHYSDPKENRQDPKFDQDKQGIFYPRGQGVGGSTQMNAQIFVRADDVDWDHIASLTGDPEWKAGNMKQYLQKLEKNEYRPVLKLLHQLGKRLGIEALQNRHSHGFDGWLETTRANPKLLLKDPQLQRIVLETGKFSFTDLGSLGDKFKRLISAFDPNDDSTQATEGLTLTPLSVTRDGRRTGPRDRLLSVAEQHPDRLTIRSGVKVDSVVLNDDKEVVDVRFCDEKGQMQVEPVGREAIISAGAFGTPELLMRSGIGPQEQLSKLEKTGVTPKVVLPGGGKSLSDRYDIGVVTRMKQPFKLLEGLGFKADEKDPNYVQWQKTGEGPYASNGAVVAFQAKSDPAMADPDLYIFGVPGSLRGTTAVIRRTR